VVRQEKADLLAPLHAAERRVLLVTPIVLLIVVLFAWARREASSSRSPS